MNLMNTLLVFCETANGNDSLRYARTMWQQQTSLKLGTGRFSARAKKSFTNKIVRQRFEIIENVC